MTQALNLANFANNLNTAGATSNSGLQNSSVTVTAGTGMSGGGAVALGSSVTLTNAGVTSVAAGTGISVSASTGGITITNSQPFTALSSQLAKAWVQFNGVTTATINGSFNVSSVTRVSTGVYTINYTTAMPNATYSANFSISQQFGTANLLGLINTGAGNVEVAPTTTSMTVCCITSAGGYGDIKYCCLTVFSS